MPLSYFCDFLRLSSVSALLLHGGVTNARGKQNLKIIKRKRTRKEENSTTEPPVGVVVSEKLAAKTWKSRRRTSLSSSLACRSSHQNHLDKYKSHSIFAAITHTHTQINERSTKTTTTTSSRGREHAFLPHAHTHDYAPSARS